MNVTEPFHSVRRPVAIISRGPLPVMPRVSSVSVGRLVGRKFSKQGQKPGIMHFVVAAASRRCRPLQPFDKIRARLPRVLAISFIVDRPRSKRGRQIRLHSSANFAASTRIPFSRVFLPSTRSNSRIRPISSRVSHADTAVVTTHRSTSRHGFASCPPSVMSLLFTLEVGR